MECLNNPKKETTVTITNVFEFAGEEVQVTKEVPVDSAEGKNAVNPCPQIDPAPEERKYFGMKAGRKKFIRGGGISAVLGNMKNKTKIGTLEKSKLDWERFKTSEGLNEDIRVHNRGRDGFLEKQDFLQRADMRQFEIEKQIREAARRNR